MEIIKSDIKNKTFKKCYLLYGGEAFIRDLYLKRLKKAVVSGPFTDMNLDTFDGAEDINRIIDAVSTLPFMSEKRLIVIKGSGLFKAGRKNDSEAVADLLENAPESTCIVFVEQEADKRLRLFKTVVKKGHTALCRAPEGAGLYTWAEKELKKKAVKMERQQTIYFFRTVGEGMENAVAELDKLANFKGPNSTVTDEDIDTICVKTAEAKIFDLVDAIGKRDTAKAIKIYRGLLMLKEQPVGILAMIARQFRLMLQAGVFASQGKSVQETASMTGQRDFVIKQCLAQSRNFTSDLLKKALRDCLDTDYGIKSGRLEPETAVEILIVKYSR
ncbi:DNA polymerase III subunit delta [Lachnospiraceae bacterium NSJ-143]|nr:DNA polymerase III subunit delta [Lachnospiraceae bacterium NSJ-143]